MISKYEKTNGVKLFALVAVLAMVFAGAAVMMNDSVDAADDATYLGGTITGDTQQTYGKGTNVIVDRDLTIPADKKLDISGKLTINEGVTVTVQAGGQLILKSGAEVKIDGNINVMGKSTDKSAGVLQNGSDKVTVNGTITLTAGGTITTVPAAEAGTVEVGDDETGNGTITLAEGGSIVMTKRSSNISSITNQNIVLNEGTTFNLNGYAYNVYINATGSAAYYTAGAMKVTSGDNKVRAEEGRESSNLTFSVTSQTVRAIIDTDADHDADATPYTVREYVIDVAGTVAATDVLTITEGVQGSTNTTAWIEDAAYYAVNSDGTFGDKLVTQTSISGDLTVNADSQIVIDANTYTAVSGNVNVKYVEPKQSADGEGDAEEALANLTLAGTVYVTGTVKVDYRSLADVSGTTGYIIVDGGAVDIAHFAFGTIDWAPENPSTVNPRINGAMYRVQLDDGTYNAFVRDLDVAITEAVAAEADEICLFSAADATEDKGAFVIDTEVTLPSNMYLIIGGVVNITETGVLTIPEDSTIEKASWGVMIYVNGKLVDSSGYATELEQDYMDYEVKKISEDEITATYTTLAIAIGEAQPGESIQLNGQVTIKENLTIPADVTVVADKTVADGAALKVEDATLTVNGILDMNAMKFELTDGNDDSKVGSIVVNNYIANVAADNFSTTISVPGAYFTGQIREDDTTSTNYIASAAVAGNYSTTTSDIKVYGKLSMGEVTFTLGENQSALTITVYDEVSGNITLVGNDVTFTLGAAASPVNAGSFTGTVNYAASTGDIVVDLNKAGGLTFKTTSADDGTTVTTGIAANGTLVGAATITSGTVDVGVGGITVSDYENKVKSVLTVGTGATLNLNANKITVEQNTMPEGTDDYAGLVVAGTLNYGKGEIDNKGIVDVTGTMNVAETKGIAGVLNVTGTLAVADEKTLTVTSMYVGDADGAAGTVTGAIALDNTNGFVVAYPAANIAGAAIALDPTTGESTANETVYYVNGEAIMTSYAYNNTPLSSIIPKVFKLTGYKPLYFNETTSNWYPTADMVKGDELDYSTAAVDNYAAVYAEAEIMNAAVRLSIGPGMSVYIDDIRYTSGVLSLAVGEHSIIIQVDPGYTGTTTVTLGGTAITGGTFTITPEMAEEYEYTDATQSNTITLSVMGDISYDTGSTDDGGMGLTEILLIILVVLIVVMAIMVALRLMRS